MIKVSQGIKCRSKCLSLRNLRLGWRCWCFRQQLVKHGLQVPMIVSLAKWDITDNFDILHIILVVKFLISYKFKYAITIFMCRLIPFWSIILTACLHWLLSCHFTWFLLLILLIYNSKTEDHFSNFLDYATRSNYFWKYIIVHLFFAFWSTWAHVMLNLPVKKFENFFSKFAFGWDIFPHV